MRTRVFAECVWLVASLFFAAPGAWSQDYPTKPIRFIVPNSPGGSTDLLAHTIAQRLSESWRQPVVVDFRAGGTGAVAAVTVAKSTPDGYSLLLGTASLLVITPALSSDLPYDPVKDLAPITVIANAPLVVSANSSLPANALGELVALAKARPGSLNYGTSGAGSLGNMTMELFKTVTATNIVHIPYKGVGAALTDVLGGHVQLMISAPSAVLPHLRTGRLKGLAVTGAKRAPELADVPTFDEAGYPAVKASSWYGVLTTMGTPKPVVDKLNREIARILQSSQVKERFIANGYNPEPTTSQEFSQLIRDDLAKWQKVAKTTGTRLD